MEHNQNGDSHRRAAPQGRTAARSDASEGRISEDIAPAEAGAENEDSLALPAFTPVPRLKDRSNGWKPEVQQRFMEALAETGSVKAACKRIGRHEPGAYRLRRHPEGASFRAAWDAALDHGVRRIEDHAMDRALYGVEEEVIQNGATVLRRRRYNEQLVMFILRNRAPERFSQGGAMGLSAIDRVKLKQLKREWRAEWDREQDEADEGALDSLDSMLDTMRNNRLANMSARTRAAYDEYLRLEALDKAGGRVIEGEVGEPDEEQPSTPDDVDGENSD